MTVGGVPVWKSDRALVTFSFHYINDYMTISS